AFIFEQNGLLYAFLYSEYIRVYPPRIIKILAKKKNDNNPSKISPADGLPFPPLLINRATLFWQCCKPTKQ
ncbi:MAG TPA: hypothetical protein DCP52_04560, partial [Elusimicrobia bacterium]|nr:hypothetical protein [Elusimicrobiota bacterium]